MSIRTSRGSCVVSQSPRRITFMSTERRTVEVCIDHSEVRVAEGSSRATALRAAPTLEQMLEAFRALQRQIGAEPEPQRVIDAMLAAAAPGTLASDLASHPS